MNTDRITKLLTRISLIDEKLENLQQEREGYITEIQTALSGGTPAAKSSKGAAKPGESLGSRIMTWLAGNPGSDLATIARALKTAPQKAGVSLYHLENKNQVYQQGEAYYCSATSAAAAKALTTDVVEEE